MAIPATRYAKAGELHIAYQVFGHGEIDLVVAPGFISNIDVCWEEPNFARWLERFGTTFRVVQFDKRGTGLSDRFSTPPTIEDRMDDVRAVMDAVGIERAAVMGISEGGSLATLFAATHPQRCIGLVLVGSFAKFSSWIRNDEAYEYILHYMNSSWGSGAGVERMAPSMRDDDAFARWYARYERSAASPASAAALMQVNREIDIVDILPSVRVPTLVLHRSGDKFVSVEGGRMLAAGIPGAKLVELAGYDHMPWIGDNADAFIDLTVEFITGAPTARPVDRLLATVLFTDIVGSTRKADELGDDRWRALLDAHNDLVRRELGNGRGEEIKTLGDGFLAIFDGPARAVRCAQAIAGAVKELGIEVRAGVHTGEIERSDKDIHGIAVHIAARVSEQAGANDVLVSRIVKDLVAGSGIVFEEHGIHTLKGIPDEWQLYRATG